MATTQLPGATDRADHKGLPVTGYRETVAAADVELVNRLKAHEEEACRLLEEIAENIRAAGLALSTAEKSAAGRALSIAKTNLEQGYMMAAKAVFRPKAGLYLLDLGRF